MNSYSGFQMIARTGYRPEIDGLRAVAVLSVFFYHLGFASIPGGFAGVDVFFVISGYLITEIIYKDIRRGNFSFSRFYARRVARIFPALFAMLAFSSVAAFLLLDPPEYRQFFRAAKYTGLQVSNFFFAQRVDYFEQGQAPSPLLHTWSLGVEEQFYLIWPLLMLAGVWLWRRQKRMLVLLGLGILFVMSLAVSEYLVRQQSNAAFYLLPARAWELAIGGFVALGIAPEVRHTWMRHALSLLSLVLLGSMFLFYDAAYGFPGLAALMPSIGAALFIYSARVATGCGHWALSIKPMIWVGLVSYSLYLWHWPLIAFFRSYMGHMPQGWITALIAVLSLILAYASYRYVERPLRHKTENASRVLLCGFASIVLVVVLTGLLRGYAESSIRVDSVLNKDVYQYSPLTERCRFSGDKFNVDSMCVRGKPTAQRRALLIGDSHAGHYAELVESWALREGLALDVVIKDGCTVWLMNNQKIKTSEQAECKLFKQSFAEYIQGYTENYDIIFLGQYTSGLLKAYVSDGYTQEQAEDQFAADIRAGFARIKHISQQVVVLGEIPLFAENPLACHYKRSLKISRWLDGRPAEACLELDRAYSDARQKNARDILASAAQEYGFLYYEPADAVTKALKSTSADKFLYKDHNHLNVAGAQALMPNFLDFMVGK